MTPKGLTETNGHGSVVLARDADTGRLLADRVALAVTRSARRKGLLGKNGLERGEALWIAPCRGVHTMGMRFAIDVIALDDDGRVIDCVEDMGPWRLRLPRWGTAGVLELAAGTLSAAGTRIGHVITFEHPRRQGTETVHGTETVRDEGRGTRD